MDFNKLIHRKACRLTQWRNDTIEKALQELLGTSDPEEARHMISGLKPYQRQMIDDMIALIDKKVDDTIREAAKMKGDWTTTAVLKDQDQHAIHIRRNVIGSVEILMYNTSVKLHVNPGRVRALANALLDIANEPTTVDGMTALKHIMDGGRAYRKIMGPECAIFLQKIAGSKPIFLYDTSLYQSFNMNADNLLATDWVLVP